MGSKDLSIKINEGKVPVGIAVQDGNYEHVNPKTGKRVTITELIEFASDYLKADYIFWCTEEPHYSNDLVPFMRSLEAVRSVSRQVGRSFGPRAIYQLQ